ncbi:MAG: hypothetical protein Q8O00_10615 [Holophaga sp.]|nr:hypothetical protein [Holophaga sp.]
MAVGVVVAQPPSDDPVMKVRSQRAAAGSDLDLPAVPRTVMEPPPLPPPEVNIKDTKGYRGKRGKKAKAGTVKKSAKTGKAVKGKKVVSRKK